jgi:hypothetical protein
LYAADRRQLHAATSLTQKFKLMRKGRQFTHTPTCEYFTYCFFEDLSTNVMNHFVNNNFPLHT